jgi:hypothetical protein
VICRCNSCREYQMLKEFDRSKQKFWVSRRGASPWNVLSMVDNSIIRTIDKDIAYQLEEQLCLVETKEELDSLIASVAQIDSAGVS